MEVFYNNAYRDYYLDNFSVATSARNIKLGFKTKFKQIQSIYVDKVYVHIYTGFACYCILR